MICPRDKIELIELNDFFYCHKCGYEWQESLLPTEHGDNLSILVKNFEYKDSCLEISFRWYCGKNYSISSDFVCFWYQDESGKMHNIDKFPRQNVVFFKHRTQQEVYEKVKWATEDMIEYNNSLDSKSKVL